MIELPRYSNERCIDWKMKKLPKKKNESPIVNILHLRLFACLFDIEKKNDCLPTNE
jgi:hypothetical protein